jgi:hypothetical protein
MAQTTNAPAHGGVIDQNDVNDWVKRFNDTLADHSLVTAPAAQDARPWYSSFFGCFSPIDTCQPFHCQHMSLADDLTGAITCCIPCVTFGKTHHRTRKHGNMEGYSAVNTSVRMPTSVSFFEFSMLTSSVPHVLRDILLCASLDPHGHAASW